jgi:hypothetical protein
VGVYNPLNNSVMSILGVYRTVMTIYHSGELATPFYCMTTIQNTLITFGMYGQGIFMTVVSLDRLLAVAFPFWYFTLTRKYSVLVLTIAVFIILQNGVMYFVVSYVQDQVANVPIICFWDTAVVNINLSSYYYSSSSYSGIASVVIYILVPLIYVCKTRNSISHATDASRKSAWKTQMRLIITLGLCSLFTLLIYVLPNYIQSRIGEFIPDKTTRTMSGYLFGSVKMCHGTCLFCVYMCRQVDMRAAVMALFGRKSLVVQQSTASIKNSVK